MIDLHCHVLPGIDDGPETIEEAVALARAAVAAGIATVVATPHVNARTPNDSATIARLVRALNQRLTDEEVGLDVLPGGEIAMTQIPEIDPAELSRLGLGGGRWLLVEPPFTTVALGLEGLVQTLHRAGHGVVLAHPERCPALQRDRSIVPSLVQGGVLMSITAGSLVGRFGSTVRRYALELAREGLVHNVTSDAHDTGGRAPGIADELQHAGLAPLAEWLTQMVPGAILRDEEIPPRPAAGVPAGRQRRRRAWRLRR
jgi:protein-tyrosine phosphatase